jgi:predicted ester cyclase
MSIIMLEPAAKNHASTRTNRAKALVQRFFDDVLARQSAGAVDAVIAPGAMVCLPTGRFYGPEAVKRAVAQIGTAFTNLRVDVSAIIAEGDQVAAEWTICGTEAGELLGVPPSGRWTCLSGLSFSRIEANRIVEHRMIEG